MARVRCSDPLLPSSCFYKACVLGIASSYLCAAVSDNDAKLMRRQIAPDGDTSILQETEGIIDEDRSFAEMDAEADVSAMQQKGVSARTQLFVQKGQSLGYAVYKDRLVVHMGGRGFDPGDGSWASSECKKNIDKLHSADATNDDLNTWNRHCIDEAVALAKLGNQDLASDAQKAAVGQTPVKITVFQDLAMKLHKLNQTGQPSWHAHYMEWMKDLTWADVQLDCGYLPRPAELNPPGQTKAADNAGGAGSSSTLEQGSEARRSTSGQETSAQHLDEEEEFDSRKHWPECADVISHIRDQKQCGSCWAMSVAAMVESQLCISSKGKFSGPSAYLSGGYIVSCFQSAAEQVDYTVYKSTIGQSNGCVGGHPTWAMDFLAKHGAPTGGSGDNWGTCMPYFASGSAMNHWSTQVPPPQCPTTCINTGYARSLEDDKYMTPETYNAVETTSFEDAKAALRTHGTIVFAIKVFKDFLFYSGGIYTCQSGCDQPVGFHLVLAIGYGSDYIIGANSWGPRWGNHGFFRIKADQVMLYWHPSAQVQTHARHQYPLPGGPSLE